MSFKRESYVLLVESDVAMCYDWNRERVSNCLVMYQRNLRKHALTATCDRADLGVTDGACATRNTGEAGICTFFGKTEGSRP